MSEQDTEDREEQKGGDSGEADSDAQQKAQNEAKEREEAADTMKELEERDEPPKDLEDWPSDKAKYMTYGGQEGDHSYAEGPEQKLGPSELRRFEDGSIEIGGEKVDDPDEHKGEPIPGGPTDPNAPDGPEKSRERVKANAEGDDGEGSEDSDSDRDDESS